MNPAPEFDVVIVGGGMVGMTLACALAPLGFRAAVVEPRPAQREWPAESFDLRVSAITRASERVFRALGAWEGMTRRRVTPYRHMHVWDASGRGVIDFDSADLGEPDLGHIVENRVILAALLERAERFDNIQLPAPARLAHLVVDPAHARVELDDGRILSAALVVGADGADSAVRDQAGIGAVGWMYDQTAVVAVVETSLGHQDTAWQRFLPDGPLAFLPLPQGRSSIVWATSPDHAKALMALDEAAFLDALQCSFGESLGRMVAAGPRAAYPLLLQHADAYVRPRVALVGNAAHSVHPLAGQGLNLGIADVAALAEVLREAKAAGRDLGGYARLRRYERWRKGENLLMLAAMDGFKRLFGSQGPLLHWLRNTGLNLTDAFPPAKALFMRHALGLSGDLPPLARRP